MTGSAGSPTCNWCKVTWLLEIRWISSSIFIQLIIGYSAYVFPLNVCQCPPLPLELGPYMMRVNVHQPLSSFWISASFLFITDILCDLSLAVALTHDFVIATQGSVSPKHTLHTHCLCAFPVCSISASCVLKLWRPQLGNSAQEKLSTSPCQELKRRLLDST